jgi:hypothetical protein
VPPLSHLARRASFTSLVLLCERRLCDALSVKTARLYGIGVLVSYLIALAVIRDGMTPEELTRRALATLSWIAGGLVAFGAARDLDRLDRESGVTSLIGLRGFDARTLELARSLSIALRVVRVVGLPGVVFSVATLGVASSASAVVCGLMRTFGVVLYALCFGLGIALLCRISVLAARTRGRLFLLALVCLPHLGRALVPGLPSVPHLYSELLGLCLGLGSGMG